MNTFRAITTYYKGYLITYIRLNELVVLDLDYKLVCPINTESEGRSIIDRFIKQKISR